MAKDITMQEAAWPRYGLWIAQTFWPLLVSEIAMVLSVAIAPHWLAG
jgi:hypothetical protein